MLATRLALLISWLPTVETPDRGKRLSGTLNDQHSAECLLTGCNHASRLPRTSPATKRGVVGELR